MIGLAIGGKRSAYTGRPQTAAMPPDSPEDASRRCASVRPAQDSPGGGGPGGGVVPESGSPERSRGVASINTPRPDAGTPRATDDIGPPADAPPAAVLRAAAQSAGPALASFRAGRSEAERIPDLLAFAIATERGFPPTSDGIERARREADAALGDHSIRYLHNTVEQIRQEAVAAHLGRPRPPPGFARLVAANVVALALAGGLAFWASTRPEVRTALAGLLGS